MVLSYREIMFLFLIACGSNPTEFLVDERVPRVLDSGVPVVRSTGATGGTSVPSVPATGETGASVPSTAWIDVSAGTSLTCGLDQDGEAFCRGGGRHVIPAPPPGPFVDIAAANGTACALDQMGTPVCWGCDNTPEMCTPPIESGFLWLDASERQFCAMRIDGTVKCWGNDLKPPASLVVLDFDPSATGFYPLLPDGTIDSESDPDAPPGGSYVGVAAGRGFACGWRADNTAECGEISLPGIPSASIKHMDGFDDTMCWLRTDDTAGCSPSARQPSLQRDGFDPATTSFATIDAGHHHGCGITLDGAAFCWPAGTPWTSWPERPL